MPGEREISRHRFGDVTLTLTSTQSGAKEIAAFDKQASLIVMSWPNFSQKTTLTFLGAESSNGTYRLIRKSDDSGSLQVYGTSASAAGHVLLPDLAGTDSIKVKSSKNLTGSYSIRFMPRG